MIIFLLFNFLHTLNPAWTGKQPEIIKVEKPSVKKSIKKSDKSSKNPQIKLKKLNKVKVYFKNIKNNPIKTDNDISKLNKLPKSVCLKLLVKLKIPFKVSKPVYGIRNPVLITGAINGVKYINAYYPKKPVLIDCTFVFPFYEAGRILKKHKITKVMFTNTYRKTKRRGYFKSKHNIGLGMDIKSFINTKNETLSIMFDWRKDYGNKGDCVGKNIKSYKALFMRKLVCELEKAMVFKLILTPDSDYDHQNHIHLSGAFPDYRYRKRYSGRYFDQPLPGTRKFKAWWRWYSCYKKRKISRILKCRRWRVKYKPDYSRLKKIIPAKFRIPFSNKEIKRLKWRGR
jgi:hypothetical protein